MRIHFIPDHNIPIHVRFAGNSTEVCTSSRGQLSDYVYFFIFGQVFNGFAGACLYTLTGPMLDENIKTKNTPLYIGKTKRIDISEP